VFLVLPTTPTTTPVQVALLTTDFRGGLGETSPNELAKRKNSLNFIDKYYIGIQCASLSGVFGFAYNNYNNYNNSSGRLTCLNNNLHIVFLAPWQKKNRKSA
jgi:hypothetical protein